jgi:hypothetical protein
MTTETEDELIPNELKARGNAMKWNFLRILAAIPAVLVALVSHFVACPACWPFVGGLISTLGLTSLLETRLMLPLFVGCLLLALAPLGFLARNHLLPFILGLVASMLIFIGKFVLATSAVIVVGIALLVGAYLWSYRARRLADTGASCSNCTTEGTGVAEIPIACALDKAQFENRKALVDRLVRGATERKAIPNGFALRFCPESGLVSQFASFVELERACCPFLTFRIDVRAGDSVWLELTGPAAAQEIIWELIQMA